MLVRALQTSQRSGIGDDLVSDRGRGFSTRMTYLHHATHPLPILRCSACMY